MDSCIARQMNFRHFKLCRQSWRQLGICSAQPQRMARKHPRQDWYGSNAMRERERAQEREREREREKNTKAANKGGVSGRLGASERKGTLGSERERERGAFHAIARGSISYSILRVMMEQRGLRRLVLWP